MIRTLIAAALLFPVAASAQQTLQDCLNDVNYFNYAASYRDEGLSPQDTFARMKRMANDDHPEQYIKGVINVVFFDPDVSRMTAVQISRSITHECVSPKKTYQPLD